MYSQQWLENQNSVKALFVIASYRDTVNNIDNTVYLSSSGYISSDGTLQFNPIIKGGVSLNESLSPSGDINFSFGDIEVNNTNGELDSWLNPSFAIWVNQPIKIYFGDPSWNVINLSQFITTFQLVFDGIISNIDSKNKNTLNIKLLDKLQRLNTPITEEVLGSYGSWVGGQSNKDSIKPLVFGEVHNFEPLLINPAVLDSQSAGGGIEYMFNNGPAEELIEVRDNGVPLYTPGQSRNDGVEVDLNTGKFILKQSLAGTCTVSVQGVKKSATFSGSGAITSTYSNTIAELIAVICTQYGKDTKLTLSDIDLSNFSSFSAAHQQKVGIVITDRQNILSVCQALASSVGAQLYFNRLGKLQLLKYGHPTTDATVSITESDMLFDSFSISDRLDIVAATKIAYCKNWYVQDNLLTGIPEEHKEMFAKEWYVDDAKVIDETVASLYKLERDPPQVDTMLLTTSDAYNEALRRNNLFKVQRTVYTFTGTSKLLSLKLGQPVTLTHSRFNLHNGVSGQVVSLSPNWLDGTVTVEVFV